MDDKHNKWKFDPSDGSEFAPTLANDEAPEEPETKESEHAFSWSAVSSPIEHKKPTWYLYLFLVTLVIATGVYFLTHDKISTSVILICGLIFGVYGARKPSKVNYKISDVGLTIGSKFYDFTKFKSFSILNSSDHFTVSFTPLKRFMPYLYINFTNKEENKITPILGKMLPVDGTKGDPIERFMRRIGF